MERNEQCVFPQNLHCPYFLPPFSSKRPGGLSADHPLAAMWAAARTLRIVDGPDEVHLRTLAKVERASQLQSPFTLLAATETATPGTGRSRL